MSAARRNHTVRHLTRHHRLTLADEGPLHSIVIAAQYGKFDLHDTVRLLVPPNIVVSLTAHPAVLSHRTQQRSGWAWDEQSVSHYASTSQRVLGALPNSTEVLRLDTTRITPQDAATQVTLRLLGAAS